MEVSFAHVDFSYGNRVILKDFCADWKAGICHYIVGSVGSGKTTLMKLVTAMLLPDRGEVRVCGCPTHSWDKERLREKIAVMSQEMILFADTILENVRLYQRQYSEEAVQKALETAGLSDRISALPCGIRTRLAEDGGPLSQGEKQRLIFARCILQNPDIYILDEPTSALDAEHKKEVIKVIANLAENHLVLVITHDREYIQPGSQVTELRQGGVG